MSTSLDRDLANILKPLVQMQMRLSVAPYPNLLCLPYHLRLAYGSEVMPQGHIQLADWNTNWQERIAELVRGKHMFYHSKTMADRLKGETIKSGGHFNSVPANTYWQRHVFVRRNDHNDSLSRH